MIIVGKQKLHKKNIANPQAPLLIDGKVVRINSKELKDKYKRVHSHTMGKKKSNTITFNN